VDDGTNLHGVLLDVQPAPEEVDVSNAQCGRLSPSDSRVGEAEHERRMRRQAGEGVHLVVAEVDAIQLPGLAGQLHSARRVPRKATVGDGHVEDACEHAVRPPTTVPNTA
jgi:hypothetical protein